MLALLVILCLIRLIGKGVLFELIDTGGIDFKRPRFLTEAIREHAISV